MSYLEDMVIGGGLGCLMVCQDCQVIAKNKLSSVSIFV